MVRMDLDPFHKIKDAVSHHIEIPQVNANASLLQGFPKALNEEMGVGSPDLQRHQDDK